MKAFSKFNLDKAVELEAECVTSAGPEGLAVNLLERSELGYETEGSEQGKEKFANARRVLDALMRRASLTAADIARRLEVPAATISRWRAGDIQPDAKQLKRLFSVMREECVSLFEGPLQPSNFEFVCSFASHYPSGHGETAMQILREVLTDPVPLNRSSEGGVELHLHIKPADLPLGVRAHCFAERSEALPPRVFVILVDKKLSEPEQYEVAWGEARAHVQSMLRAYCLDCGQPSRIVKGS